MEFLKRLREITAKPVERLTAEEKAFLLARRSYLSKAERKKFAKLIEEHERKLAQAEEKPKK